MLRKMTKLVIAMVALVCMGGGILISCSNSSDGGNNSNIVAPDYLKINGTTVIGYIENKLPANGAIEIPEGVTSIGKSAFEDCKSIKSVKIPSSVTTIGKEAFRDCSNLTGAITIPKGVTKISDYVFYGCKFTEITISDGVIEIGEFAFFNCRLTGDLVIPASVTKIGGSAFAFNYELQSVTFKDTEGWYDIKGKKIDVSDSENNVSELTEQSNSWTWSGIHKQTN